VTLGLPREYLQYLLPGILVQTVVFNSVYSGKGLATAWARVCSTASDRCRSGRGRRLPG